MSDPLTEIARQFVRRGQAAQAAVNDVFARESSFPYWRIWQAYKHLNGVTYEVVLGKVDWFDHHPHVLEYWLNTGGDANLSHVVAVAYKREMDRRARVIAEEGTVG